MLHSKYRYSKDCKNYFGQIVKVYSSETEYEYHFIEDKYKGLDIVINDINDTRTIGILVEVLEDGREIYSNDTINFYLKHDGEYTNCKLVYSKETFSYLVFTESDEQIGHSDTLKELCRYPTYNDL